MTLQIQSAKKMRVIQSFIKQVHRGTRDKPTNVDRHGCSQHRFIKFQRIT